MAQLFAAVQGGQAMPDGTPTAALPGNGAPPGPTGQLAGVQTPNPVNSAVGGIVQGALGAGPMRRDVLASQQAGAIVGPGAAAPPGG
jgi:hypothetical protein